MVRNLTITNSQYGEVQPYLSSVTYIAIDGESLGQHERRVAFSGCFKGQHKAEILSGLPEDRLGSGVSTSSNTAQLEWVVLGIRQIFLVRRNDVEQQLQWMMWNHAPLQNYNDAILQSSIFKIFSTWYLHWRGIELLSNDCLFFSKSHPQSPNAKNMNRICSLSNSIHLKNNYLQQG